MSEKQTPSYNRSQLPCLVAVALASDLRDSLRKGQLSTVSNDRRRRSLIDADEGAGGYIPVVDDAGDAESCELGVEV